MSLLEMSTQRGQVERMEPAYKLLTVAEFLDACPNDQRHYQLLDGVIVAMAPPGTAHQVIAGRLSGAIFASLSITRPECFVRPQAGIAPMGLRGRDHFETDLTVSCAPLDRDRRGMVSEPLLIVEILSPSTDRDDVFVKLPAYQRITSLREILYVETERTAATVYRRGSAEEWETIAVGGADRLRLATIGLDVPLADLYRGIPDCRPDRYSRLISRAITRRWEACNPTWPIWKAAPGEAKLSRWNRPISFSRSRNFSTPVRTTSAITSCSAASSSRWRRLPSRIR